MESQKVEEIDISELILWSENPREPISSDSSNQDIVDLALNDRSSKWQLKKLIKEMGDWFDLSELPTVVRHEGAPIVYDGNRRVILAKIYHNLVNVNSPLGLTIPVFPKKIPCNVCDKKTALKNVYRKHADGGSWDPLERDIFLSKHMGDAKSIFLLIEESTNLISNHPKMNQRFVKEEVLKNEILKRMGFEVKDGLLHSKHSEDEAGKVLLDLVNKVNNKTLTTRGKNRGMVIENLDPDIKEIIENNKNNDLTLFEVIKEPIKANEVIPFQTRRVRVVNHLLFGGKLYLRSGYVNNLYRDIAEIYDIHLKDKSHFTSNFIGLIRMSLRLLLEVAATDENLSISEYLSKYFSSAKSNLSQDVKNTLNAQNVISDSILPLMHAGAHNYKNSQNEEQAVAISIIIGAILTITHGKEV